MPNFAFAETLTIRRLGPRDRFGDLTSGVPDRDVDGCVVWPTGSDENTDMRDQVNAELTALLPAGTDVKATDEILRGGEPFEVIGRPEQYRNPFTGTDPGVLINLRRTTG